MEKELLEKIQKQLHNLYAEKGFFVQAESNGPTMQGKYKRVIGIFDKAREQLDPVNDKDLIKFLNDEQQRALTITDIKNLVGMPYTKGELINKQYERFALQKLKYNEVELFAIKDSVSKVQAYVNDSTNVNFTPAKPLDNNLKVIEK